MCGSRSKACTSRAPNFSKIISAPTPRPQPISKTFKPSVRPPSLSKSPASCRRCTRERNGLFIKAFSTRFSFITTPKVAKHFLTYPDLRTSDLTPGITRPRDCRNMTSSMSRVGCLPLFDCAPRYLLALKNHCRSPTQMPMPSVPALHLMPGTAVAEDGMKHGPGAPSRRPLEIPACLTST